MSTIWFLVAENAGAWIYSRKGHHEIELLETIPHPEGKLHEKDLKSDKPGRAFSTGQVKRNTFSTEHSAEETETGNFARHLADKIEKAAYDNSFEKLTLVAGPHMLGVLRRHLGSHSRSKIDQEFSLDLGSLDEQGRVEKLEAISKMANPK